MSDGIEIDTKAFERSISAYLELSGKDAAIELNRRMLQVLRKAIQLTKSADPAKIRAYMQNEGIMYRLVPGKGISRAERAKKARRLLARAVSSVRYIKAGYWKGLGEFGGRAGKPRAGKSAARGWGKKATMTRLVAEVANTSFGAEEVSGDALQSAINTVTDDMLEYIWRKLGENWSR